MLLIIPQELLSLVMGLSDLASLFSLKATSKGISKKCVKDVHTRNVYIHNVHKFKWLMFEGYLRSITNDLCVCVAVCSGHLNIVKHLHDSERYFMGRQYCLFAAEYGHLDVLKYVYEHGDKYDTRRHEDWSNYTTINHNDEYYWERCIHEKASQHGHLEIVKYIVENNRSTSVWCCNWAAENGHLEIVKYLHETNRHHWDEYTCMHAAGNGHLEVLKYLHKHGCPWNDGASACYVAVRDGGHLEVLKYLHENGCLWDEDIYKCTVEHGHLEILKYLYENSSPLQIIEFECDNAFFWAVDHGYLEIVKYLHEHEYPWDRSTCEKAAFENNDMEILKYLQES